MIAALFVLANVGGNIHGDSEECNEFNSFCNNLITNYFNLVTFCAENNILLLDFVSF